MTKEELRAAVEAEFAKQQGQPEPQAEEPEVEEPKDGDPYQTKDGWEVVIDLKDGSGTQVFHDPTLKGLIAKLTKAQEHAVQTGDIPDRTDRGDS